MTDQTPARTAPQTVAFRIEPDHWRLLNHAAKYAGVSLSAKVRELAISWAREIDAEAAAMEASK